MSDPAAAFVARNRRPALLLPLLVVAAVAAALAPRIGSAQDPAPIPAPAPAPPPADGTAGSEPDKAEEAKLELRSRRVGVMGTELFVEVIGPDIQVLESALDAAVAEIVRIEDLMTDWRASPLMDLNAAAGKGPQLASEEILRIVRQSQEIHEYTEGAFDITYATVGRLWDFKKRPPVIPSPEAIAAALPFVDASKLKVDLAAGTLEIPAGMSIGLGGIAQGYAADRMMQIIMDRGIRHAMVNVSGDLKVLGRKRGELWQIAIKHPRERDTMIALLPVSNTCVVTSGDYERFFDHEGRRYHHIIDPKTGYPSQGCISATVIAPEAAIADAFATALVVLGPERGLPLIEALPRIEALVVDLAGKVHATSGLKDKILPPGSPMAPPPMEPPPPAAPAPSPAPPPAPSPAPAPPPGGGR